MKNLQRIRLRSTAGGAGMLALAAMLILFGPRTASADSSRPNHAPETHEEAIPEESAPTAGHVHTDACAHGEAKKEGGHVHTDACAHGEAKKEEDDGDPDEHEEAAHVHSEACAHGDAKSDLFGYVGAKISGEHVHTDACTHSDTPDDNDDNAEAVPVHSDACAHGKAESENAHVHTDACARSAAPDPSVHIHSDACTHGDVKEEGEHVHTDACTHGEDGLHDGHELTVTPETLQLYDLRIGKTERQSPGLVIEAPARVVFNTESIARVSTPVEGRILEIPARIGDNVERGDVLLRIHSPFLGEAQNELFRKQAELEAAQSAFEVAESERDRGRKLLEGKGISEADYLRREGEFKKAQGALTTARAAVRASENVLAIYGYEKQEIRAMAETGEVNPVYSIPSPISGQIVERAATVGQVVGPGDDSLLLIADVNSWWVLASVPSHRAGSIRLGSIARVTFERSGLQPINGRVAYISPIVEESTRAAQVRIEIPSGHESLRAGMFGRASFNGNDAELGADSVTIPRSALWSIDGLAYVFAPDAADSLKYHVRPVAVGATFGDSVEIVKGLRSGDPIVREGGFILKADLNKSRAKACCEH